MDVSVQVVRPAKGNAGEVFETRMWFMQASVAVSLLHPGKVSPNRLRHFPGIVGTLCRLDRQAPFRQLD